MYLEALSMACQALQDWGARVGGVTRGEILQAHALPQQLAWQSTWAMSAVQSLTWLFTRMWACYVPDFFVVFPAHRLHHPAGQGNDNKPKQH